MATICCAAGSIHVLHGWYCPNYFCTGNATKADYISHSSLNNAVDCLGASFRPGVPSTRG
jgi:hypothetical protein